MTIIQNSIFTMQIIHFGIQDDEGSDDESDNQTLNIRKEILSKNKNIDEKDEIFNMMTTQCLSTYKEAMISKDSKNGTQL